MNSPLKVLSEERRAPFKLPSPGLDTRDLSSRVIPQTPLTLGDLKYCGKDHEQPDEVGVGDVRETLEELQVPR